VSSLAQSNETLNPEVTALLTCLSVVADSRKRRGVRFPLIEILFTAILGSLCGCDDAEALEDWGRKEIAWLRKYLRFERGAPKQDVYLRVLGALESEQFRAAFLQWSQHLFDTLGFPSQIAIDGQTHRGSRTRYKKPVHMVHAFACDLGLVIAQEPTSEKSNEITAIPRVLDLLDLRGALVSMDAMGCQTKIANRVKSGGGDYLFGLKGNQSTLHNEVKEVFVAATKSQSKNIDEATPPEVRSATQCDSGHGRIETRTAYVCTEWGDWLTSDQRWSHLRTLIAIRSHTEEVGSEKVSEETRYYISSRELSPDEAIVATRKHWQVESLHWCLDVSFGQDSNTTRTVNTVKNLAVIRHFAINILKHFKGDRYSIPRRRRQCDYSPEYRSAVLGG